MNRYGVLGILLSVWLGVTASVSQAAWSGTCVGVLDGDTIRVMHHDKPQKIRLFGVDCPERDQDFGNRARQFTASMVFGKRVTVEPVDRDAFDRTVAWVSVDGASLNRELVRAGLAWWFRRYAPKHRDLKRLEREARNAGIGLWSKPNPTPPWKFRRDHR